MATKLLTLASFAALTLTGACQVEPVAKPTPLTPVTIHAPQPSLVVEILASIPAQSPIIEEKVAPEVVAKPRRAKPRPAALVVAPPVIESAPAPSLAVPNQDIASPRVDRDGRPATGNVMSRTANYR